MSIWVRIGHLLRPGFGRKQAFPLFALLAVVGYATGCLGIFLAASVGQMLPSARDSLGQNLASAFFTSPDDRSKQSTPCRRA